MNGRNLSTLLSLAFISSLAIGATGCSSASKNKFVAMDVRTKFRSLASEEDLNTLDSAEAKPAFEKMLNSSDQKEFDRRLQIQLDAIEEVYLRAHNYMKKFDSALNDGSRSGASIKQFYDQLMNSGVYAHLLALHDQQIMLQHQLLDTYKEFQRILAAPNSSRQDRERAESAIRYIGNYYSDLPLRYLVAHDQLALDLHKLGIADANFERGFARLFNGKLRNPDEVFEVTANYAATVENPEVRGGIDQTAAEVESIPTHLSQKIEQEAAQIQEAFNAEPGRTPQAAAKIEPSAGPSGNITGNGFPKGIWSLTFDDGPHATYTHQVLENLKQNNMKATFFMLAGNASQYPKIAQSERDAGMETANHSYTHPQLPKLSDQKLYHEIHDSTQKLTEILELRPKVFRCPYGAGVSVPRVRSLIAKEGMVDVFWNVDSLDWQDRNPESVFERVKKEMALAKNGGGVILFHDIHPQSVVASKKVMEYLNERSLREMPVSEVIQMINGQ